MPVIIGRDVWLVMIRITGRLRHRDSKNQLEPYNRLRCATEFHCRLHANLPPSHCYPQGSVTSAHSAFYAELVIEDLDVAVTEEDGYERSIMTCERRPGAMEIN